MNERARTEREAAEKLKRRTDLTINFAVGGTEVLHESLARARDLGLSLWPWWFVVR